MVKRSRLELDDSLLEKEQRPLMERGRTDNTLVVAGVLSVLILVLLALTADVANWKSFIWSVVLLGLVFAASELFALPLRSGGRISLALLPVVMAMMISGPLCAALVTLFGIPIFYMERGEQGARRIVFNTCQYLFSAGAAAWVFHHVGGAVFKPDLANAGKLVFPWLLATVVFFVLNTILCTPVLTPESERLSRFWLRRMLAKLPGYIVYAGIGFLAAIVYVRLEFAAVVLLFAPLLGMRVVYTRYGTMRDVCDDTTLTVMAAVEAGDMFNEGHSLGVADMAVAIAEEMDFQEEDIHFLRQAALLHDVGKLALDSSITEKPGSLTPEEYEEIKKHPLIGGRIVSREPSFAVVAPAIIHHHEAIDGSGYVDGLSGDSIPLGARILAVADAFDAMQHTSTYREPLDSYRAASEIIRGKGIQFDPEVVDAFSSVVGRRGIWTGSLTEKLEMPGAADEAQPRLPVDVEQPTLDGVIAGGAEGEKVQEKVESGATPGEGVAYTEIRGEIEKDIREWERSEGGNKTQGPRRESRRRPGSLRRKKEHKEEKPEGEES